MFCFVFCGRGSTEEKRWLVERLRREVEEGLVVKVAENGAESEGKNKEVTLAVDAATIEARCPLLVSCYKETVRWVVHQLATRTVMSDTVLRDPRGNGREYLLKTGTLVQMAFGVGHGMEEYWGPRVDEVDLERFVSDGKKASSEGGGDAEGPGSARAMRTAFQPFGGGIHQCPGRRFAFVEIMAFIATMVLDYDIEPLEDGVPEFAALPMVAAVAKPANDGQGFGVRICRRKGWEGVRWSYKSHISPTNPTNQPYQPTPTMSESAAPTFILNLSTASPDQAVRFYTSLSFTHLPDWSYPGKTASFLLPAPNSHVGLMVHAKDQFKTFLPYGKAVANTRASAQALLSIMVKSKEEVDEWIEKVKATGVGRVDQVVFNGDYGVSMGMYTRSWEDGDGNAWEVFCMLAGAGGKEGEGEEEKKE
ncbi:hypothetical protein VTJ49DRAFT_5055 [Mycothermus thermophilus]|uniref:VOC domain-containing protein n=1 Tax=Humicola insolens TaxID=85995 RepID=A0ABR3V4H9_HUMIN